MTNSLLRPSELEFRLPDYANLTDEDFREAVEAGMREQRAALDDVAASTEAPTVDNVLVAWELSSATLDRALNAFWVAMAADRTPARNAIEAELAPRLAAHADAILLNRALYQRLVALRDAGLELDEESAHLLAERIKDFEQGGIALPEDQQQRLKEINARLAQLATQFDSAIVEGRNAAAVQVTNEAELDGLPDDDRAMARDAARAAGKEGWLIELVNTTGQPVLDSLTNRGLRERIFRASIGRGLGGRHDVRGHIVELVALRAERAHLLGHDHHASWVAADGCAKTTQAVNDILSRLAPGVREIAEREAVDLQARLETIEPGATLEPWDWQFLAARAAAENAVDGEALVAYLEFERVLTEGVFAAATALYGISFKLRLDLVGYTPESRVYQVLEPDGSPLGAVILDPYTRPTKQGGAWMTSIVDQSRMLDLQPVVTNTCNFNAPAPGRPSLLTWDNVITLFHEFGHDLHGLLSDVEYPSRSGTATPRDFVEFPSQVNEIWAWEPSLIARYARHHETGEPMPAEWIEKLVANRGQGVGHEKFETLAAMLLDQAWHQTPADELPTHPDAVEAFEAAALERAGVNFPLVPPRYRSGYFHHIFGGGYSAAYYSYIWSEVMDADTVAWFAEHGGLNREAGEHFRRTLLASGGSIDVMAAYRRFRGQDPDVWHLLERIGLS